MVGASKNHKPSKIVKALLFTLVFSLLSLCSGYAWADNAADSTATFSEARALFSNEKHLESIEALIAFLKDQPNSEHSEDASYLANIIIEYRLSDDEFESLSTRALLSNEYMDSMRKLRSGERLKTTPYFSAAIIRSIVPHQKSQSGERPKVCNAPAPPDNLEPDIIVSARVGNDDYADGKCFAFKTISGALKNIKTNGVVWVAPGTYYSIYGENFPILIPEGVSLIGDEINKGNGTTPTVITGSGYAAKGRSTNDYYSTIKGSEGSTVSGFIIKTDNKELLRFGLYSLDSDITIRNNTFIDSYGGVTLHGGGNPLVENNIFSTKYYGIYTHCIGIATIQENDFIEGSYITNSHGDSIIRKNRFSGHSSSGISVHYGSPRIEDNTFKASYVYGALYLGYRTYPVVRRNTFEIFGGAAIKIGKNALPDLGTASDPGNNTFIGNKGTAIISESVTTINAIGNKWNSSRPVCGTDIKLPKNGSVIWGSRRNERCDR